MERQQLSTSFSGLTRFLLLLLLVTGLGTVSADLEEDWPQVEPQHAVTVKAGTSFTLTCHGKLPVFWNFNSWDLEKYKVLASVGEYEVASKISPICIISAALDKNDSRVEIRNITSTGNLATTVLTIHNVTGMDANTFHCQEIEDNTRDAYGIIFVDDEDKLVVAVTANQNGGVIFETAIKGTRYTLRSCRPTHPGVKVTLSHESQAPINPVEDPAWSFSDEDGFTIDPVVTSSTGIYICRGVKGSRDETYYLSLHVIDAVVVPTIRPSINGTNIRSASVGDTYQLDCNIVSDKSAYYGLNWTEPKAVLQSGRATIQIVNLGDNKDKRKKYRARLTVTNAQKEDGENPFVCVATHMTTNLSVNDTVSIYEPGDEFIELNTSKDGNITVNASEDAQWVIDFSGYPMPVDFSWKNKKGYDLGGLRYDTKFLPNQKQVVLKIHDVTMPDGGRYEFTVGNGELEKSLNLFLTVRDKPEVYILKKRNLTFFNVNKDYNFMCKANGFPYPTVAWSFKECPPDNLTESQCKDFAPLESSRPPRQISGEDGPMHTLMTTNFTITASGYLRCSAYNSIGSHEDTVLIVAVDFPDTEVQGYGIHGPTEPLNTRPIEMQDVEYICSASKVNFTQTGRWLYLSPDSKDSIPVEKLEGVTVESNSSEWSFQKVLKISKITTNYSGVYMCEVVPLNPELEVLTANISVTVLEKTKPTIIDTNLNSERLEVTITNWNKKMPQKFFCNASGVPEPEITWFLNGEPLKDREDLRESIKFGKNYIRFEDLKRESAGEYSCRATNERGTDVRSITIDVQSDNWGIYATVAIVGLLLLVALLLSYIYYKYKREQKMKLWLKSLNLQDFENGDVEKINPEQGIADQVNLLPYDKKYEFPISRLKLGVQIGSGAFGRVLRAQAAGIKEGEAESTVAVKMVKPTGEDIHFKALMSELKIMIHLGQHVNVVNLLGACTKQLLKKRELLVIVEYCKYGSLLSYLHRHQNNFVDQLDRELDIVDPNLCFPIDQQCQSPMQRLNYAALTFTDSGGNSRPTANGYHTMNEIPMSQLSPRGSGHQDDYALSTHVQSVCTDMSYVSNSPTVLDTDGNRRISSTSTWNGHYRGIYQYRDVRPITTTDLLCWNFQVARGMEYLSSRNVLHGDLAARNVLLAENNVVKICDFGLAKEMYQEKYRKKTEVPLPIKWMAIESIYYRVFSTQSDVWSFGVVMWELFTLGKNPYPGMEPDEEFYSSLNQGYRMEKPRYAPSSIYDLMCYCWDKEPSLRPSFTAIADRIGDLMEEGLRKHYLDLNVPYTSMNQELMRDRTDYLGQMSGPDFACVSKRATPDRSYANMPEHLGGDYLSPKSLAGLGSPMSLGVPMYGNPGEYQNLETGIPNPEDLRMSRLANNTGYVYMNSRDSPGPVDIFSPRPDGETADPVQGLQFRFEDNPDLVQSSVPGTNGTESGPSRTPSPLPYSSEVQGISNVNYVPNNIFERKNFENALGLGPPNSVEPNKEIGNGKRHKNDSGVSSIDSNFEANLKRSSPPPNPLTNGGLITLHNVPTILTSTG